MLQKILDTLRGTVLTPAATAFARGLVESLAFLALYSVADYIFTLPDGNGLMLALLPIFVRTAEGLVDKIDAAKQRQRAALLSEAAFSAALPEAQSELQPGDVKA